MNIKVFITIDTEEDNWGDFSLKNYSVNNIFNIPLLQDIFDQFNAIPTYLITYPVITNNDAVHLLKKIHEKGKCEIGTHCHPWNTPPFLEKINNYNSMLCNLPYELIFQKIMSIHREIEKHLQVKPISFRAGRWGFGFRVAKALQELKYTVDTSIVPYCDLTTDHGLDFSNAQNCIYKFDSYDILTKNSNGSIIEVPPSIGYLQNYYTVATKLRQVILNTYLSKFKLLGILEKLKLLNFRWLSPELSSSSDMIKLSKTLVSNGVKHLNLCFHSTSLLPGKSPFVQNKKDLVEFLNRIQTYCKFANDSGFQFASLSSLIT